LSILKWPLNCHVDSTTWQPVQESKDNSAALMGAFGWCQVEIFSADGVWAFNRSNWGKNLLEG
jgi:hypothetical protein